MKFEKSYYVYSEVSNYKDYRGKKFTGLAKDLISELNLGSQDKVLDFGAATGGLVKSLIDRGVGEVVGTDISYWAIDYGRKAFNLSEKELQHYNRQLLEDDFEYIFFLDVLEHMHDEELVKVLQMIHSNNIIVRLPVSLIEGGDFVLDVSKNDKTHVQIHPKHWWNSLFENVGYYTSSILNLKNIYESEGVLARRYEKSNTY